VFTVFIFTKKQIALLLMRLRLGHWNPTHTKHGKWTDAEHHKGDIGNITADEKGNATMTLKTTEWCIGCGDETKDILGKG
jgi:Cu-Zn family superoxide dismutase